ncbi:MAG: hypothetical protein IKQ40_02460 [Lachnospiraceae bacterium]|nr:hypothetical protein [Lachnospiraceae bacterium]
MADQKNKRTALTVQDVIGGHSDRSHPRFKSGYSGPKKPPKSGYTGPKKPPRYLDIDEPDSDRGSARPVSTGTVYKSGGILDYAWIPYCAVLAIALTTAILVYGAGRHEGIYYPVNIPTISGIVSQIFTEYRGDGLGSEYRKHQSQHDETVENGDNSTLLGETSTAATPNSTTGATMTLDEGGAHGDFQAATSHEELLQQLDSALAANNSEFVGMKLAYENPDDESLTGYPQSVVEHFTKYMSDNSDKRANFLAEIKDESDFSAKNKEAYLVKLPLLQFTINMGYDGTTISMSGFSDQHMDSGQSAVVSPLLPCMYTIHAETAKGSLTSEVECNMKEGNLQLNIGVTN